MGFDRSGEIFEDVAILLAAGFDDREHGLYEAATTRALRAEGKLAPDHRVSQRTFARVTGRNRETGPATPCGPASIRCNW